MSASLVRRVCAGVVLSLIAAALLAIVVPAAPVPAAVMNQPQLGVVNAVPTPSGTAYVASSYVTVVPGTNNATTDTSHRGLLTIFFSCDSCQSVVFSGATFYLYLSQSGLASLSPDDTEYAGPFLVSNFTSNVGTLGKVVQKSGIGNGTYYIGTVTSLAGCSGGCEVVEGPVPNLIESGGYTFLKVYDGNAIVARQTIQSTVTVTTTSTATSSSSSSTTTSRTTVSTTRSSTTSASTSVSLGPTSTQVGCVPSPVVLGSASTCTATVTGASPTGTVDWTATEPGAESPFLVSACELSSGSCSVTVSPASGGSPVVVGATYEGDSANAGSSGSFMLEVTKAASATSVSCFPASIVEGTSALCTAAVTGYSPTGTVQWSSDQSATFSGQTCTLSFGSCSVSVTASSTPSLTVTASYGGDAANLGSQGTSSVQVSPASIVSSQTTRSTSTTTSSSSSTSTTRTSTTSTASKTIPEFPYQLPAIMLLVGTIAVTYALVRRTKQSSPAPSAPPQT